MLALSWILIAVVVVALIFDFTNGFHDAANAIATSIGTRALRPTTALAMAAVLNIVGGLIYPTKVANTITQIVDPHIASQELVLAALLGAIVWNLITWYFGIPSSSSHALIGGLMGAAVAASYTLGSINWQNVLQKVIIPTVASPVAGFILAALVTAVLYRLVHGGKNPLERVVVWTSSFLLFAAFTVFLLQVVRSVIELTAAALSSAKHASSGHSKDLTVDWKAEHPLLKFSSDLVTLLKTGFAEHPAWYLFLAAAGTVAALWVMSGVVGRGPAEVNGRFRFLQTLSAGFMALEHGHNDAQKTMGIITLALLAAKSITPEDGVPTWVKLACATVIGLGTFSGGKRIIKTMGMKLVKLEPIDGFAAETVAASVINAAGTFGMPISTTHAITAAITGVGATKRISAVRWGVTGQILMAWIVTLPAAALMAALAYAALRLFMR